MEEQIVECYYCGSKEITAYMNYSEWFDRHYCDECEDEHLLICEHEKEKNPYDEERIK
jgi:hypothetical protein